MSRARILPLSDGRFLPQVWHWRLGTFGAAVNDEKGDDVSYATRDEALGVLRYYGIMAGDLAINEAEAQEGAHARELRLQIAQLVKERDELGLMHCNVARLLNVPFLGKSHPEISRAITARLTEGDVA